MMSTTSLAWSQGDAFEDPQAVEEAEAIFREARALWKEKRRLEACAKFRESFERAELVGNQLNLGRCAEQQNRPAEAYAFYRRAEVLAGQHSDSVRAEAAARLAEGVAANLGELTVTVPSDIEGLTLLVDGREMPVDQSGVATMMVPGKLEVTASAPGYLRFEARVEVTAGGRHEVLVVLEKEPVVPPAPPDGPAPIAAPGPTPAPAPVLDESTSMSSLRVAGIVLGVVGVLVLGAGAIAGGLALSAESDAEAQCPLDAATVIGDDRVCDARGLGLVEDARNRATGSTAMLLIGGTLSAVGVVMIIVGEDDKEIAIAPRVGPAWFGVSITGAF